MKLQPRSCGCEPRAPVFLGRGNKLSVKEPPRVLDLLKGKYVECSLFEAAELHLLFEALTEAGGNQKKAGELLGLSQRVMNYHVKKHDLYDLCRMLGGAPRIGREEE